MRTSAAWCPVKKLPLIVGVVLAIGLIALFAFRIRQSGERAEATKAAVEKEVVPSVRVAAASAKDLPQVVQITGSVRAVNEVQVLARGQGGRITSVRADVGAVVKQGDVLAAMESVEMSLRVRQSQAQAQSARAGLEQAKVQQTQAGRAFARATALREKGSINLIDLENAETQHKLADVGVMAAEAQVALAEANLGLSQKSFEDTRITSPIAGIVTRKMISVGAMASAAAPSFSVQDQSSLKLEGTVPAAFFSRMKVGLMTRIVVDELPGRTFEGTVTRLAPTLEDESRRGQIEIAMQPAEGLLPHMHARAEIAFGTTSDVIVVPSSAVLSVGGQPAVYVVRGEKATLVRPKLGTTHLDEIIIEEGVASGDSVVISGDTGLKDGTRVRVLGS